MFLAGSFGEKTTIEKGEPSRSKLIQLLPSL
jgi:hypothetical protein